MNRVSLIILYDSDRKYLLQHRTKDALRIPDYWGFFGGGIKKGESIIDTVFREAQEEIGYQLREPILVYEQPFVLSNKEQSITQSKDKGYMYVFVEKLFGKKDNIKLNEGQSFGWFTLSETKSLKIMKHDRFVLEKVEEYLLNKNLSSGMDL